MPNDVVSGDVPAPHRGRRGAAASEYVLMLGLVTLCLVALMSVFGSQLRSTWAANSSAVLDPGAGGSGGGAAHGGAANSAGADHANPNGAGHGNGNGGCAGPTC